MPFNSLNFILFFSLFALFYFMVNERYRRVFVALIGSYVFYLYAGIASLLYLFIITLITYIAVRKLRFDSVRKPILYVSILCIVIILISSKYWKETGLYFLGKNHTTFFEGVSFLFPIGISFYALQSISLIVEVATKRYTEPLTFSKIALFTSFFPQSLAGPIHRPQELLPQFFTPKRFDAEAIVIGLKTLLFGFFLKLIVADKIALVISPVFHKWIEADGLSLIIASLLYSLQIYFDFWGYSLIAIGLGRILGYQLKINFNHPYSAVTFKEFWHRWHISLSQWMRDYIYIPLGGRKKGYLYFATGILVTFLVSGIWHGISYNFFLWGGLHALLYLLEDYIFKIKSRLKILRLPNSIFILAVKKVIFFLIISFTWLVFRTENLNDLNGILAKIFSKIYEWSPSISQIHYLTGVNLIYVLIAVLTFAVSNMFFFERIINITPTQRWQRITDSTFTCFCLISIIFLGDIGGQEFLYFKF